MNNLTVDQIAKRLGVSRQTVASKIKRAGLMPVGTTKQRVVSTTGAMILKSKLFSFDEFERAVL